MDVASSRSWTPLRSGWEAKDGEDPDTVAEARDRLLNTLDESPELTATMTRLARSLASIPPPVRQSVRTTSRQPS